MDVMEIIQDDIQRSIEEGLNHYKALMEDLLRSLHPFKDSQLKEYHTKNLQVIIHAFECSFSDIVTQLQGMNIQNQIKENITKAKTKLETLANAQFTDVHLKKHEIQIENIVKKVKGFSSAAEILYDERANEPIQSSTVISRNGVQVGHEKWKNEALQLFHKLLITNKLTNDEFWSSELIKNLEERKVDLCKGCVENDSPGGAVIPDYPRNDSVPHVEIDHDEVNNQTHTEIASDQSKQVEPPVTDKKEIRTPMTTRNTHFPATATIPRIQTYETSSTSETKEPKTISDSKISPNTISTSTFPSVAMSDIKSNKPVDFASFVQATRMDNDDTHGLASNFPTKSSPSFQTSNVAPLGISGTKASNLNKHIKSSSNSITFPSVKAKKLQENSSRSKYINSATVGDVYQKNRSGESTIKAISTTSNTTNSTCITETFSRLQAKSQLATRNVGIGVYFDKNSLQIGTSEVSTMDSADFRLQDHFTELYSASPEIYFSDNGVLIGKQAHPYHALNDGRYFQVFQLLQPKKSISLHKLLIQQVIYNVCDHEIFAMFLKQIIELVESDNNVRIRKIVFTIPFLPASSTKEKILESARIAGFADSRILSTVLTSGIAGLAGFDIFNYYTDEENSNERNKCKTVFVVDCTEHSFSMGIVEISPTLITVNNFFGSDNMAECQDNQFKQVHASLYNDHPIHKPFQDRIRKIYGAAINHVFKNKTTLSGTVEGICIACNANKSNEIHKILFDILKGKVILLDISLGPLLGASLLAASFSASERPSLYEISTSSLLLSKCTVQDCGRSNLRIHSDLMTSQLKPWPLIGKQFHNEQLFVQTMQFSLSKNRDFSFPVQLEELFGPEELKFDICKYQITCKYKTPDTDNSFRAFVPTDYIKAEIEIRCLTDADGVFNLRIDNHLNFPMDLFVQRTDNLNCKSSCKHEIFSGYAKLLKLYERKLKYQTS